MCSWHFSLVKLVVFSADIRMIASAETASAAALALLCFWPWLVSLFAVGFSSFCVWVWPTHITHSNVCIHTQTGFNMFQCLQELWALRPSLLCVHTSLLRAAFFSYSYLACGSLPQGLPRQGRLGRGFRGAGD